MQKAKRGKKGKNITTVKFLKGRTGNTVNRLAPWTEDRLWEGLALLMLRLVPWTEDTCRLWEGYAESKLSSSPEKNGLGQQLSSACSGCAMYPEPKVRWGKLLTQDYYRGTQRHHMKSFILYEAKDTRISRIWFMLVEIIFLLILFIYHVYTGILI